MAHLYTRWQYKKASRFLTSAIFLAMIFASQACSGSQEPHKITQPTSSLSRQEVKKEIRLVIQHLVYDPATRTVGCDVQNNSDYEVRDVQLVYCNTSEGITERQVMLKGEKAGSIAIPFIAPHTMGRVHELPIDFKGASLAKFTFELVCDENVVGEAIKECVFINEEAWFKAVEVADIDRMKALWAHGVDLNIKDKKTGWTGLQKAIFVKGNKAIVQFFLEKGADVNLQAADGDAALHFAVSLGEVEVVKWILNKGADVNLKGQYDRTALHVAALNGHLEIVKLLLAVPYVDLKIKSKDGKTALKYAKSKNYKQIEVLIKMLHAALGTMKWEDVPHDHMLHQGFSPDAVLVTFMG
eukprot:gene151-204_t